jgi:TonB family protein
MNRPSGFARRAMSAAMGCCAAPKRQFACALAFGLASCATPYIPPAAPAPPSWMGAHGMERIPGTLQKFDGRRQAGDIILENDVRFVRTGIIAQTVKTSDPYGRDIILPEGTKVYATNYTLSRSGVKQENDPIEWCAVLPDGLNGMQKSSQTVCLFWESALRARYIEDFRVGGFAFAPFIDGRGDVVGVPGPVPEIIEKPVDFGVTIKSFFRIARIDRSGVRIDYVLSDGSNERLERSLNAPWDKNKMIVLGDDVESAIFRPLEDFRAVSVVVFPQMPSVPPDAQKENPGVNKGANKDALPPQGAAEVRFRVSETGSVSDCSVLSLSGDPRIRDDACSLVNKWTYKPEIENGKAVAVWKTARVTFLLK